MLETAGLWYNKKISNYKIGHQIVDDVSSYREYFLEVVKALGPIRWNVQPVMAASNDIVPLSLMTSFPMKLPAEGCGLCLAFSVAGALDYMGKKEAARLASKDAFTWSNSPPNVAISMMERLFAKFLPETAQPVVFGGNNMG